MSTDWRICPCGIYDDVVASEHNRGSKERPSTCLGCSGHPGPRRSLPFKPAVYSHIYGGAVCVAQHDDEADA